MTGEIKLLLKTSNVGVEPMKIEVFNALASRAFTSKTRESLSGIVEGDVLLTLSDKPAASRQGLLQINTANSLDGIIGFNANGSLQSVSADGLNKYEIISTNYPYLCLIEYLKTASFTIKKVRMSSSASSKQLTQNWQIVKTFPTGRVDQKDLVIMNILNPENISTLVSYFNCNILVDKFTAIYIPVEANNDLELTFTVEIHNI